MKNKKHFAALATTAALLAINGVAAGGAQATTNAPAPLEESTAVFDSAPETSTPAIGVDFVGEQPLSPVSHQNAVAKAEDYLDYTAFSRQGLIDQLEYDDFSTEDATFAVDNIIVDWNEQAAKKHRSTSTTPHSPVADSSTSSSMTGSLQRRRRMERQLSGTSSD